MDFEQFRIPLGSSLEALINILSDHLAPLTKAISAVLETAIDAIDSGLMHLPPWALILALGLVAWRLGSRRIGLFTVLGLGLIWNLGLWDPTIATITLVLFATAIATCLGVPLGILAAMHKGWARLIMRCSISCRPCRPSSI